MPISGTFLADFKAFDEACKKAVVSLTDVESGGAKVEKSLNRMADSFSGKKIISEAKLMARLFDDAGGAATFTTAELRRMGVVGAEAMEKLRKGGQPIPEQLMAMGRATRQFGDAAAGGAGAAGKMEKLGLSIGATDALLGRFGINLPPQVRGLADLASGGVTAAGKLTLLGAGALVVGTSIAAWKLGEKIGEMTGLTDAIAKGTAAARGWGDAIVQNAAYSADVLGRASKTAGRGITDMTEAMAINQAEAERLIAVNIKGGAAAQQLAADDAKAAEIMVANREKLRKVEFDLVVAQLASEKALKQAIADTTAALVADAAQEEILANGTASEIIKKQNHDVYLAKLADLVANKTDTIANRTAIAAFEATANAHDLVNQETLHTGRLKDAQDLAEVELNTYTEMSQHADQYTRGALQAQLEKYRELAFAATASGRASVDAQDAGAAATERHTAALDKQKKAEAALAAISENRRIRDTGGLYTIDEAGNAHASGDTVVGATLEGKTSPVSGSNRTNADFLAREIARLQALTERYVAAPMRTYANDQAGARQAEAIVQQHLDAVQQLAYLEQLLAAVSGTGGGGSATGAGVGSGPGIPTSGGGRGRGLAVTVPGSGVFDPSARHVLAGAVGEGLMRAVQNGRPG